PRGAPAVGVVLTGSTLIAAAVVAPTVTVKVLFATALPLVAVSWYEVVMVGATETLLWPVRSPRVPITTLASAGSTVKNSLVDWPDSMASVAAWKVRIVTVSSEPPQAAAVHTAQTVRMRSARFMAYLQTW